MSALPGPDVAADITAGAASVLAVDPPRAIRPVTLLDQDSRAIAFPSADARWRLVVFGFTNCPDVCPMTLHKTAQLLTQLKDDANRIQIVFVSIDGSRDDTTAMRDFVRKFDPRIMGLTGDAEALQAIANEFGVLTRRFQGKTALAYTLVHSSLIYLLDPKGQVRSIYPQKISLDAWAADLSRRWRPSPKAGSDAELPNEVVAHGNAIIAALEIQ